jgi:hypothetical protein
MSEKREKFYTVSARLVFASIIVILIVVAILGISIAINKGPVVPLLGVGVVSTTTMPYVSSTAASTSIPQQANTPVIIVEATCAPLYTFACVNPYFNYSTGVLTVALSQSSAYNWTSVTVRFVPVGTAYSNGVPVLSWSPPAAVNVTGGLLSNVTKYINIPVTNGPVAVGTNITGSIWAKYQLNVGGGVSYANMSSAVIVVKRSS